MHMQQFVSCEDHVSTINRCKADHRPALVPNVFRRIPQVLKETEKGIRKYRGAVTTMTMLLTSTKSGNLDDWHRIYVSGSRV